MIMAFSLLRLLNEANVGPNICMKHQDAPGTTFKRHKAIADGLMSEDDYLLSEILFNPHTSGQLTKIQQKLAELQQIVEEHDNEAMQNYLDLVRQNLK